MGNPHVVIPVTDVMAVDLERFGAELEVHPAFPARTNVHFVQVLTPTHLVMRVWERGAGPTWPAAPAPAPRWWCATAWGSASAGPASTCRAVRWRSPGMKPAATCS